MTPTNAARDALEDLIEAVDKALENGDHETVLAKAGILTLQHGDTLHSILTALSAVDFEALGEAITRLKKGYAQFDTFGTTYAVLYSENNENDLNLIEEAARLVLSLGKPQKIDPLAATPDGLVSE